MKRALIGHSGFVGSNLKRQESYTHVYNSGNFREMAGQRYDEVVCAGVSAVKWLANKEPEQDWRGISALLDVLAEVEADRFTLISTIDVYPNPSLPLDEGHRPAPEQSQPYGRHRLAVEDFVTARFPRTLIARLPALFGQGLRKNIVFDLLTNNQTEKINPSAAFQWYPLDRLADDLATARAADLRLVNLFTEPFASDRIIRDLFPGVEVGAPVQPAPRYDLRTAHAQHFGADRDGYLMAADSVLKSLADFVDAARRDREGMLTR